MENYCKLCGYTASETYSELKHTRSQREEERGQCHQGQEGEGGREEGCPEGCRPHRQLSLEEGLGEEAGSEAV